MDYIVIIPLLLILLIVSIWDIRTKRIPNAFIFIGLLLGLASSFVVGGVAGLLHSLLATLISFVVFIWFWGFIAAGDVKLMFVIASFLGVGEAFTILMISFLVAALFLFIVKYKDTISSIEKIKYFLFYKVPIPAISKSKSRAYSPFIFISFVLVVFI